MIRPFHRIESLPRGEGFRTHFVLPLCYVGKTNTTNQGLTTLSGFGAHVIALNPGALFRWSSANLTVSAANWISPVIQQINEVFGKYKIRRLRIHYQPQSSTNTTDAFAFAFSQDPAKDVLYTPTTAAINPSTMLGFMDSVAFSAWNRWTLNLDRAIDKEKEYLCEAELVISRDATGPDYNLGAAGLRQTCFGAIGCSLTATASASLNTGVIYLESEIDFLQMAPSQTSYLVAPLRPYLPIKRVRDEFVRLVGKLVEEEKERERGEILENKVGDVPHINLCGESPPNLGERETPLRDWRESKVAQQAEQRGFSSSPLSKRGT
jgi:hypothetical protein